jgi:hypothetical protein
VSAANIDGFRKTTLACGMSYWELYVLGMHTRPAVRRFLCMALVDRSVLHYGDTKTDD